MSRGYGILFSITCTKRGTGAPEGAFCVFFFPGEIRFARCVMSPKNRSGMSSSVGISSSEMSSVRKKERARAQGLLAERREELRKMV